METFSLLDYWKNSGAVSSGLTFLPHSTDSSCRYSDETSVMEAEEEASAADDEGPFFDLEFTLPVEEEESEENTIGGGDGDSDCTDGGCEFTLSSCSGGEDREDPDLDFSPSGDIYFKEHIVEEDAEPPSSSFTGAEQTCSVKAPAAQLSASILKSATKLRVFMHRMKKSKLIQAKSEGDFGSGDFDKQNSPSPSLSHSPESQQKVEDVPIISVFTSENSSRNSSSSFSSSSSSSKK